MRLPRPAGVLAWRAVQAELTGFTVAVTADRRADEQLLMLRRLGVATMHVPTIRTLPITGGEGLRAATESLITRPPDVVVANTSLGVRSWLGLASTWGLDGPLLDVLGGARIVARGPKAAGAATTAGLDVAWRAPGGRLEEVADHLVATGVAGARVAVLLDGDRSGVTSERLRGAGAEVVELPVYRWSLPGDGEAIGRLVERCCAGALDAVTFTAAPALRNLFSAAAELGQAEPLRRALADAVVACIGPVCADAARAEGLTPVVPDAWRLGSLVRLVGDELAARRRAYCADGTPLVVQGAVVVVAGRPVALTDRERAVLHALVRRDGAVAGRATLQREVWGGGDVHTLETVVGRLRAKLGPAGGAVATVVRRGYRWAAVAS